MTADKRPGVLWAIHDPNIIDHAWALGSQLAAAGAEVCWTWAGLDPDPGSLPVPPPIRRAPVPLDKTTDGSERSSALFVQTPYDEQRAQRWHEIGLSEGLTYAGYGLNLTNWTRGHYELPFYHRCRHLLVSSPAAAGRYISRGIQQDRVIHTGDAFMWDLKRRHGGRIPERPRLVWMPHWTLDWFGSPGYSTWSEAVFDVLAIAEKEPALRVTIRPHPLLTAQKRREHSLTSAAAWDELERLPNVATSRASFMDDLLAASAVLTDGVSSIAYTAGLGIPLAVNRRPDSAPFSEDGQAILERAKVVTDSDSRRQWLRQILEPADTPDESLIAVVDRLYPLREESPGAVFLDRLSNA